MAEAPIQLFLANILITFPPYLCLIYIMQYVNGNGNSSFIRTMIWTMIISVLISFYGTIFFEIDETGFFSEAANRLYTPFAAVTVIVGQFLAVKEYSFRFILLFLFGTVLINTGTQTAYFFTVNITERMHIYAPIPNIISSTIIMPLIFIGVLYMMEKAKFPQFFSKIKMSWKTTVFACIVCFILANIAEIMDFIVPNISKQIPFAIPMLILISFLTFLIYYSFYIHTQEQIKTQETIFMQQQSYVSSLETVQREMRILQHDYKNILSGLYLQVEEGNIGDVQQYISQTLDTFNGVIGNKIKQNTHLSNIKNINLKSVVLSKILIMEEKGIIVNLEIIEPIIIIKMNVQNLIRCIGILLDNAIEAVEKMPSEQQIIHLVMLNENNNITIMVKNSITTRPNIQEIWIEGFSTKGKNRGLGLSSYKKIIDNEPHVFRETIADEKHFTQVMKISA